VEHAVPILPSRDLDETLAFYERLGFESRGAPHAQYDYLIIGRGTVALHFYLDRDVDPLTTAASCYVYVNDADALFSDWDAVGDPTDPTNGCSLMPPLPVVSGKQAVAAFERLGWLLTASAAAIACSSKRGTGPIYQSPCMAQLIVGCSSHRSARRSARSRSSSPR